MLGIALPARKSERMATSVQWVVGMTVRKLDDGKPKPWLVEVYPQGRDGPRKRKRHATKGEALVWEKHMLAQPWQQPEAGNVDERRLGVVQ